jgi:hypothetical protein
VSNRPKTIGIGSIAVLRNPLIGPVGLAKGSDGTAPIKNQRKKFFSEEKNQKTSPRFAPTPHQRAKRPADVFCFFFSKKKRLLPFLQQHPPASRVSSNHADVPPAR